MCSILDSLYLGCKAQKSALEKCKGVKNVAKIIETRLYTMQLTLKLTYRNSDIASCNIFKKEEVTSKRPLTTTSRTNVKLNHNSNQGNSNNHRERLNQDASHDNSAALMFVPNSLLLCVILLSYSFYFF